MNILSGFWQEFVKTAPPCQPFVANIVRSFLNENLVCNDIIRHNWHYKINLIFTVRPTIANLKDLITIFIMINILEWRKGIHFELPKSQTVLIELAEKPASSSSWRALSTWMIGHKNVRWGSSQKGKNRIQGPGGHFSLHLFQILDDWTIINHQKGDKR